MLLGSRREQRSCVGQSWALGSAERLRLQERVLTRRRFVREGDKFRKLVAGLDVTMDLVGGGVGQKGCLLDRAPVAWASDVLVGSVCRVGRLGICVKIVVWHWVP